MVIGGLILGSGARHQGTGTREVDAADCVSLLYYPFVSHQNIIYGRYLLPLVPFLSFLAAAAVVSGVSLLRRYEIPRQARSALIVALVLLAVAPPAYTSISYDADAAKVWTTEQAYEWILRSCRTARRSRSRRARCSCPPTTRRLRQATAPGPRSRRTRRAGTDISGRLVAGLRPVFDEPQDTPTSTPTTRGCFAQTARSRASRRRRSIPVRSCAS